jgi:hypothetical protein
VNKITFDQEHYHIIPRMEAWCREQFGPGTWVFISSQHSIGWPSEAVWQGLDSYAWAIHYDFGNATFIFKKDEHYEWFTLRWG